MNTSLLAPPEIVSALAPAEILSLPSLPSRLSFPRLPSSERAGPVRCCHCPDRRKWYPALAGDHRVIALVAEDEIPVVTRGRKESAPLKRVLSAAFYCNNRRLAQKALLMKESRAGFKSGFAS
jgi:hypothetical protein